MPLDGIKAVLDAPDVAARNARISDHLARMERQLAQVQSSVSALRALLTGPAVQPAVELRSIPRVSALAIAEVVTVDELAQWAGPVLADLAAARAQAGLRATGCVGALYPGDFFKLERAEVTMFLPVEAHEGGRAGWSPGRVRLVEIPATDAAVAVHQGWLAEVDQTYAALGITVAERAIGVNGPIREYFLVGWPDTDDESRHRTEVCWPVFRTTPDNSK